MLLILRTKILGIVGILKLRKFCITELIERRKKTKQNSLST